MKVSKYEMVVLTTHEGHRYVWNRVLQDVCFFEKGRRRPSGTFGLPMKANTLYGAIRMACRREMERAEEL